MKQALNESWCYETLRRARWPKGPACPRCGGNRITTHSKRSGAPRRKYLCRDCRRIFTDLTGTPLARTNLPLSKWFLCLQLMGEGRKTAYLAKALGVRWDTAARLERRLSLEPGGRAFLEKLHKAAREAQWG